METAILVAIITNIFITITAEIRRSRCSHIEISSDGIKLDREVIEKEE